MPNYTKQKNNNYFLMRDLSIVFLSILVSIIIVHTGALKSMLNSMQGYMILGSFIAGIFWVSTFTMAPSTIMFTQLAQNNPLWQVAVFGALGALAGDLIIFHFVEDNLSQDIMRMLSSGTTKKIKALSKTKFFRWLTPVIGTVILVTPLPDDLALMLMGITKVRLTVFIPIVLIFSFLGIMGISFLLRGII